MLTFSLAKAVCVYRNALVLLMVIKGNRDIIPNWNDIQITLIILTSFALSFQEERVGFKCRESQDLKEFYCFGFPKYVAIYMNSW